MAVPPEERRQQILQAAIRVFARDGYYTAKVSDVAREAGVAHGTVYLYFKSKEDLLLGIFTDSMAEMIDTIEEQIRSTDGPEAKLRRLIQVQLEMIETYPELTELILVELRQSGKFLHKEAIAQIQRYLGIIEDILDEGVRQGVFVPDLDREVTATLIYAGIEGLATRWILEGKAKTLDRASESISRLLLEGIRARTTSTIDPLTH